MKILKLLNQTTNSIKHINAAEYVIPEQPSLDENVDETADEDRGPLRRRWDEEYDTNVSYTEACIQPAIYPDNTVGESSTINHKNHFPNQPPFNLIYNETSNMCWLITLIHNIRANTELKKYIFENCTNDNVKKGLHKLLSIHGRDITEDDLITEYESDFINGGSQILFLMFLFVPIEKNRVQKNAYKHKDIQLFDVFECDSGDVYDIMLYAIMKNQPIMEIYPPKNISINGYLSVSNAILGRPNDSHKSDENIEDLVIFNHTPTFLIISIEDEQYHLSLGRFRKIEGIIIEKSIHINVEGKTERQEYLLTGISLKNRVENEYWHSRSLIKHENQWYDTEYLTVQELNKIRDDYELPQRLFVDELNMCSEVKLDYLKSDAMRFVDILFYQLS